MKSSSRVVKYGKFYERKNQYDEVIFQDGSDDLPPGVSEGRYLLYEGGIEDEEESDFISARMLCLHGIPGGMRRQEDLQNGRKNGV